MTPEAALWLACVAAEVAALGLGVVHAARVVNFSETSQRIRNLSTFRAVSRSPLVRLLAAAVAIDLSVAALGLAFDGLPRPLHGWPRAAYHIADALVMLWPCALAWAAVRVFGPTPATTSAPSSRPATGHPYRAAPLAVEAPKRESFDPLLALAGLYLAAVVALAACYPIPRRDVQRVLLSVELAVVVVAWRAIYLGRGATWRLEHRAVVWLLSFETMIATVGPFGRDVFRDWPLIGAGIYLAAFGGLCVLLARAVRRA